MGIVYLISVLLLCTGFILIKKTDKEIDIISFVSVTIVVLFTYNAFICYVMTFARVPITLLSLSIINLIFSGIMFGINIKKKEIQKYQLNKFNLICLIIILIAVLFVSYLNFGFPFNIKYETGDPSVHYMTSVLFSKQDKLLNLNVDELYGANLLKTRKIASYVNSGIIMKCCSSFMDELDYYNIFIIFGIFVFFLTGTMMYSTLEKFTKSKSHKILALIISILYLMGYPLNSFLFGFEYLSLGILILSTIIHMVYYFENEEFKFPFYVIIFALLNFGIFSSYYMFVPFAYSALWIYFCIYYKRKNKKIICKQNVIMLLVTLILPFFLGYIYYIAPGIYNIFNLEAWEALKASTEYTSYLLNKGLATYGYIYVNHYSNTLLLIPFTAYYIYKKIKQKEYFSFDIILLVFLVIFILLLQIGLAFDKVSAYYLMKNYFALWILLMYMNFRGLIYAYEKDKKITYIAVIFYIAIIILNLLFIDAPLGKGPDNPNENPANFVEIFGVNKMIIKYRKEVYNVDEIEILRYVKNNLDLSNDKIEFIADSQQMFWEYSLLGYVNYDEIINSKEYGGEAKLTLKTRYAYKKIGEVDYMVYFKKSVYYPVVKEAIFENGKVIYENEAGGIIKYK